MLEEDQNKDTYEEEVEADPKANEVVEADNANVDEVQTQTDRLIQLLNHNVKDVEEKQRWNTLPGIRTNDIMLTSLLWENLVVQGLYHYPPTWDP